MFCALLGHTGERLQDHLSSGYEDLTKIIFELSSNTHFISSAVHVSHPCLSVLAKKDSNKLYSYIQDRGICQSHVCGKNVRNYNDIYMYSISFTSFEL